LTAKSDTSAQQRVDAFDRRVLSLTGLGDAGAGAAAGALLVQVGILLAALPPAATSLTVAQRDAADVEGIAAAIGLATAPGCITWPLLAWLQLGDAPR